MNIKDKNVLFTIEWGGACRLGPGDVVLARRELGYRLEGTEQAGGQTVRRVVPDVAEAVLVLRLHHGAPPCSCAASPARRA